jgi:outer membrane lipoprotein SlyB
MEGTDNLRNTDSSHKPDGILYPVLLIAAIAVIVFSVVGVATMMGYLPKALSEAEHAPAGGVAKSAAPPNVETPTPAAPVNRSSRPQTRAGSPVAGSRCDDCGVIESIRAVESRGQGSGLGAIGGAVVGGVLGNQVGRGSGRTAATVVGAGAGAYAGHEIEKNMNRGVSYQVRVRMHDGTVRTFHEAAQPPYSIGQKVRVGERGIVAPAG